VRSHSSVQPHIQSHGLLTVSEVEFIESEIGKSFIDICGPEMETMRILLREKVWFGFDLDDTLHEFHKASGAAATAVFHHIHNTHHIAIDDLKATYSTILMRRTSNAFTDGKTSTEYRKERFSALLQAHSIVSNEDILDHLANLYKNTLKQSLQLKPGALHLLRNLHALHKKIIVITEGPLDAQQWTIEALGIAPYIDILVTTNELGMSKVDGLFGAVLQKFRIDSEEMVYVGDSGARDVAPASKEGIWAWLYDEKDSCRFDMEAPRINSLAKMGHILGETPNELD